MPKGSGTAECAWPAKGILGTRPAYRISRPYKALAQHQAVVVASTSTRGTERLSWNVTRLLVCGSVAGKKNVLKRT